MKRAVNHGLFLCTLFFVLTAFGENARSSSSSNELHDSDFEVSGGQVSVSGIQFVWINEAGNFDIVLENSDNSDPSTKQKILIFDSAKNPVAYQFVNKTADSVVLKPRWPLKDFRNYVIQAGTKSLYAYYSMEYVAKKYNYKGPLGPLLSANEQDVDFHLWSPTAESVGIDFLDPKTDAVLWQQDLVPGSRGVWFLKASIPTGSQLHSFKGLHYRYRVHAFGQTLTALDPYARSMAAYNPGGADPLGTAALIPEPKISAYQPLSVDAASSTDFVGMELHIRDASIDPSSGVPTASRGTYLGLLPLLNYYKSLGVTHLQLMPLQKFYSVDERNRSYQKNLPAINHPNYSWGYDPQNYFTPEGWYSSDPEDPELRIQEVKQMVDAIHAAGLGVILDAVYNHVGNGSGFEASAPGMYLRRDRDGTISTLTGAGSTFETRSVMGRRLIVDSLKYWQDVFHVDGFRFDWMGFMDHETMRQIRATLNPATVLYGEAWPTTDLPSKEATTKTHLPKGLFVGAFNDTSRDSFAGRDNKGNGFVEGTTVDLSVVRAGIVGSIRNHPQENQFIGPNRMIDNSLYNTFARSPAETINCLTVHDGFTLWDKINLSIDASKASKEAMIKNALAMLFTSQGRILLLGGDELGRSKPLAENDPDLKDAVSAPYVIPGGPNGTTLFFQPNSYSSPDYTNGIRWDQRSSNSDLIAYLQGLISLRHAVPALRFADADSIRKKLSFLETDENAAIVAYTVQNDGASSSAELPVKNLVVVHNGERDERTVDLPMVQDTQQWSIFVDCDHAGTVALQSKSVFLQQGQLTLQGNCSAVIGQ